MTILQWFMAATLLLPFGVASAATSSAVNVPITITATPSGSDEEFVGPFASWMDATKTAANGGCTKNTSAGADNTGTNDATTAIQNCINSLSSSKPVIYFPCGTYNISTTLTLANQTQVSLIGQDNSTAGGHCTTTLKWTGSNGGKLIYINGVNHSQLTRLTFDGNSLANILVDQSWDSSTGPFDTGNQYIDDVFKNGNDNTTSYGFRCGALGAGCSEVNLLRDTFIGPNLAWGVMTCNANALDVWIWYSSFSNMRVAIANGSNDIPGVGGSCSGGSWHAVGNVFSGSLYSDLHNIGSGYMVNALDNYSTGSTRFFTGLGHPTFQRNMIIDTNLSVDRAIYAEDFALLLDNTIENTNTTATYVSSNRIISIGNSFTRSSAVFPSTYEYGDQTISYAPPSPPTLPGTLPNNNRAIYETSPTGSGSSCFVGQPGFAPCSIQTAVCLAATGSAGFSGGNCTGTVNSNRSVVHVPAGTYAISSTLSIPVNSNIQMIGDGWNSEVTSTTANPLMTMTGPSRATVRDLWIHGIYGSVSNDGIYITNADQVGGYVYIMNQSRIGTSAVSIALKDLANVLINANELQTPYDSGPYDIIQNGSNHFNRFFGTQGTFLLSGAANAEMLGVWVESGGSNYTLMENNISGTGSFVSSTHRFGDPTNDNNYILNNFTGSFALLDSFITGDGCPITGYPVSTTGSSAAAMVIVGVNGFDTLTPISNSAGSTLKSLGNIATRCISPNQNLTDVPSPITQSDLATVASKLAYFRSTKPLVPTGTPTGTTGVELYNLLVDGFATAVRVTP